MNRNIRLFVSLLSAVILVGCETTPQQTTSLPEPSPSATSSTSRSQNPSNVQMVSQLREIQEELKQLRNAVEELQFETENAKRRQQDLFQDLDRRLVSIERGTRVAGAGTGDSGAVSSGIGTGFDTSNAVIPGAEGSSGDGTANQVTVIGSGDSSVGGGSQESADTGTSIASVTAGLGSVSLDEQQAYEDAFEMLKQSRYEDSIILFQKLVDSWPQSELADDAYYWMSEARYVNREFEHALSGFRTVVAEYPESQRVPEALLKIGYIQYDIGIYDEAAETFRDILARFPGHQVTVSAQTRLRRIEQTIQ